jgi:zinc-binding alcohol dehydrogenase/oxidoreductase
MATQDPRQERSSDRTMHAAVLEKEGQGFGVRVQQAPVRRPGPGEVAVALKAAALNRRDYWISVGKYAGIRTPCILGSDGAGVIIEVGAGVRESLLGQEVVINPSLGWGSSQEAQGDGYRILGLPDDGTLAERVVVPAGNVVRKPAHLSWAEAAALPLAGLTAYRALCVRGALRPGETVLIPGIGSGVSTMVLMLARHLGARCLVTSSSPAKLAAARELGAEQGVLYTDADWDKQLQQHLGGATVDVAVDGAGGESWARCVNLMRPGGRLVSYGATAGLAQLDLRKHFWKQLNILGSTMGSERDFAAMVALVEAGQLRPRVDSVVPLAQAGAALSRMENGEHMGKLVLQIES